MKLIAFIFSIVLCASAFSQSHMVPGHYTKKGKYVPAHMSKPKKSKSQTEADMTAKGMHREHRYYPGHLTSKGKYVKPHWAWVWVKN